MRRLSSATQRHAGPDAAPVDSDEIGARASSVVVRAPRTHDASDCSSLRYLRFRTSACRLRPLLGAGDAGAASGEARTGSGFGRKQPDGVLAGGFLFENYLSCRVGLFDDVFATPLRLWSKGDGAYTDYSGYKGTMTPCNEYGMRCTDFLP